MLKFRKSAESTTSPSKDLLKEVAVDVLKCTEKHPHIPAFLVATYGTSLYVACTAQSHSFTKTAMVFTAGHVLALMVNAVIDFSSDIYSGTRACFENYSAVMALSGVALFGASSPFENLESKANPNAVKAPISSEMPKEAHKPVTKPAFSTLGNN